ncbi:MAG: glycosyltransferase family 39 protein [Anaerolineae bacterium]|nr:glycosyltransferase family 39 protein [Anaerolineae bacterium]
MHLSVSPSQQSDKISRNALLVHYIKMTLVTLHPPPKRALVIILLALLFRLPLVFTPLTYALSDTWRAADTASIAHNFVGQYNILYPQIDWGGTGPGYVEAEFQLYTFIIALSYGVFGEHVILGRLVSLTFSAGMLVVFYYLARRLTGERVALWSLIFMAISPLSVRYSVAFMPEATVFFFYVLALYLFQRWLDTNYTSTLMLTGVATALALLVKPTSIHIGLIFLLLMLVKWRLSFLKQGRVWVFALISIVPSLLWYWHARNLYLTYGNTFGIISGGDSKFASLQDLVNPKFYSRLAMLDINWVFAWGGALLFGVGLIVVLRRRKPLMILFGLIVVGLYYIIVGRYSQEAWGIQYHIYILPYAALGVGMGVVRLLRVIVMQDDPRKWIGRAYAVVGVVLLVIMAARSGMIYYNDLLEPSGQPQWDCAQVVREIVPEADHIIVSSPSPAKENGQANNYQEPNIFFYSHRHGWSLPSDWHTPQQVEAYRKQSATYFVIYDKTLYDSVPDLITYLAASAEQVGPGIEFGCGIFQLNSQGGSAISKGIWIRSNSPFTIFIFLITQATYYW